MAIVEISTCRVSTGTRDDFVGVTREQPVPPLAEAGIDVIIGSYHAVVLEASVLSSMPPAGQ